MWASILEHFVISFLIDISIFSLCLLLKIFSFSSGFHGLVLSLSIRPWPSFFENEGNSCEMSKFLSIK